MSLFFWLAFNPWYHLAVLIYIFLLFTIALLFQFNGTPVWTRTLDDVLHQKIPARQPQRPRVSSTPRSQPPTYKLQLFGGRWKKGGKAGVLSETTSVQDGSDYSISFKLPATTDDGPPPPYPWIWMSWNFIIIELFKSYNYFQVSTFKFFPQVLIT